MIQDKKMGFCVRQYNRLRYKKLNHKDAINSVLYLNYLDDIQKDKFINAVSKTKR